MANQLDLKHIQKLYSLYSKQIHISFAVLVVLAVGVYYYLNGYQKPREEKANDAIFYAQRFFQEDSLDVALNGSGSKKGFLNIIKNYDGTKAANLACYYAGIIYLKKGQFDKAIELLSKVHTSSTLFEGYVKGALADAYSENKQMDKAVALYKEVASLLKEDNVWGAENLLKAGLLLEVQSKPAEAQEVYKQLLVQFPESNQRQLVEKYLARLGYKE